MSDAETITHLVVRILAAANVLFVPVRHSLHVASFKTVAAIYERRQAYPRSGVSFIGGGDAAARQEFSRDVAELVSAGLLVRTGRTQNAGALLTLVGEVWAQALVACAAVDHQQPWALLTLVDVLTGGRGFVNEQDILRIPHHKLESRHLVQLELTAEPLLLRGWLESGGDLTGACGYHVTARGRAALKAGKPTEPPDLPAFDEVASDLYDRLHKEGLAGRESWKPAENPHNLIIPLGTGDWKQIDPEPPEAAALRQVVLSMFEEPA